VRDLIRSRDAAAVSRWSQENPGLASEVLKSALQNMSGGAQAVDRAVRAAITEEKLKLEKGLSVLATLGANAPFIGLFGTVLGIIRSFAALGETSGAASSVMSGISLALLATAAGLFVAIPAVVAFNYFSQKLRVMIAEGETLKDLFVANFTNRS
jgi:biopolymer transport protein ExbB/TolQ